MQIFTKEFKVVRELNILMLVGVLFISMLGLVTHAAISSRSFQKNVVDLYSSLGVGHRDMGAGVTRVAKLSSAVSLSDSRPMDGVYNYGVLEGDGFFDVIEKTYQLCFGFPSKLYGRHVPLLFLIPFFIHLGVVILLSLVVSCSRFCVAIYFPRRPFGKRALFAAIYAYVIMVFFQSARMIWGSDEWDSKYFVSYEYGWAAFYLFLGLCIMMYFYCVIGTAGLQVRRKPTAKKQTCIRCKYDMGDSACCAECGLEAGAFIDSKFRVNHLYLAGMMLVTFFSPVLVASVYSVLG